ncbi:MAG: DUF460 domain-containing protein [Candidatus Anstonellales archaeon]
MEYVIVGVDPGQNLGYALLSLDGKKIASGSIKGGSINNFISMLQGYAPVLVATDVKKPSSKVRKIASALGVKVFRLRRNLTLEEKCRASDFSDPHERDAYAAARKAYNHYLNAFRHIEKVYPTGGDERKKNIVSGRRRSQG